MTLKMKMIGAVLASALLGGVGQAKADVLRVDVRENGAGFVQPGPRSDGWRQRQHDGPTAFAEASNHGRRYEVRRGEDPSTVARDLRAETDQAARDLRLDVRRGTVEPRALSALEVDRRELERTLASASIKGFITGRDRVQLEQQVQEIRDLHRQFLCARPAPVRNRR
jgi:hypothetical protein